MNMKHIVALSGGKDSTAMALRMKELELGAGNLEFVCTPTGDEMPAMVEHWVKLGQMLGQLIKPIGCGRSLSDLIHIQQALPNWRMRWCTRMLKIEPFEQYILANTPCTVYIGIRADEADREGVDYEANEGVTRSYPLVTWGWGIQQVRGFLQNRGVSIPERTDCGSCFFQTLWEWYVLWRDHPERYAHYCSWEDQVGHTLRSDKRDTWPADLRSLGECFASGRAPKQRMAMKDRSTMCSVCAR